MAKFTRFEDIESWQKARVLTRRIYDLSDDGQFARDFRFRDQICSASVSIMSNIAEGFERGGNKEFCNFLSIAKGSAGEVRSLLYVASDRRYINQSAFAELMEMSQEISRMLTGLRSYLSSSSMRGPKFNSQRLSQL